MSKRSFVESLNEAVEGFFYVVRNERNMRIHFLFAFFVLLTAIFLGVSRIEWMMLCGVVSLVLVAEMVNTAIEETVDLLRRDFDPTAKIIKHVSARHMGWLVSRAFHVFSPRPHALSLL